MKLYPNVLAICLSLFSFSVWARPLVTGSTEHFQSPGALEGHYTRCEYRIVPSGTWTLDERTGMAYTIEVQLYGEFAYTSKYVDVTVRLSEGEQSIPENYQFGDFNENVQYSNGVLKSVQRQALADGLPIWSSQVTKVEISADLSSVKRVSVQVDKWMDIGAADEEKSFSCEFK